MDKKEGHLINDDLDDIYAIYELKKMAKDYKKMLWPS